MSNPGPAAANAAAAPSQNGPRQTYKKPNFNLIHKDPLPILTQPLPELVLHNPVSVARFLFSYFLATSHSHPSPLYTGIFDPNSSSVHIKDEETRTALWRSGFFGKGNLSRSEPTWLIRTKRACGVIGQNENLTPEEVTERRRIQRREFKKERDMLEKERIRAQLIKEGKLKEDKTASEDSTPTGEAASSKASPAAQPAAQPAEELVVMDIADQEHMQLTPEEAFFLAYGLGTFQVLDPLSKVFNPPLSSPPSSILYPIKLPIQTLLMTLSANEYQPHVLVLETHRPQRTPQALPPILLLPSTQSR